ncbi:chemotaxis protein histidine kinase CheA [Pseudomonas viridiflava]
MSTEQQIITIDDISADNAPAIYVTGGLNQFLQAVTAEVTAEVPDLTTRKGRERIASLAAKVSKSKAAVEKPGRDYLKRLKEMPKVVETELREFVTKMDALRDATRQPLTDWEKAEDARVDAHNEGIQRLKDMAVFEATPTAAHVAKVIADLEMVALDDSWQEFLPEAAQVKDRSLATLRALLADRTKHEAELAAIAQFNADQAKREQDARDAEIARKASEQVRIDAEQKAQAERDAAAKREQDLKDQAEAQQRAAEQKIRDAEAEAERQKLQIKLQEEQAARQGLEAEQERIAATQRAEQERIAAEKRQAEAVERARLAEIERANKAAAEIVRQQELRAADTAHKASINRAALEAFIAGGMPEECAKQAVTLIAQRKIPNISIQY